jgi:hypothetical protein
MWPVHQRMAELHILHKKRPLTESEEKELYQCMEANANKAWKLAQLKNLSLLASITNDTQWQHEICAQIDKTYPYGTVL